MTENVPKKAEGIPRGVSEATIQRMLSLQESRITLELKQADIQLKELDHNQKIADKSIDAQASDRRDERAVNKTVQMHRLVFAAFIVMVTVVLIVFALFIGKEAIVLDIVKVLCGFAGGYGVSSYISAKHKSEERG
jgi:Flp pilus assembly protein TadB